MCAWGDRMLRSAMKQVINFTGNSGQEFVVVARKFGLSKTATDNNLTTTASSAANSPVTKQAVTIVASHLISLLTQILIYKVVSA